jgi:glycosyltransferase involved in cell wall biosynthesis
MIEDRIIICIASNWFYDPTSKHHVMRVLSRKNHVIWVNYHGSRRPRATWGDIRSAAGKLRQFIEGPRRVSDNMTVLTPMVIPGSTSPSIVRLNRKLLVRQIRSIIRSLPNAPVQLWSFAPDVDFLVGEFGEETVVYYCVDEFSAFAGYDREAILTCEKRLASGADLVVTTSQALLSAKRGLNRRTVLIPHGVDQSHFSSAMDGSVTIPGDIAKLPRPILGFWGLIQEWVDADLIAHVAAARPDWSIVLIGEVRRELGALAHLSNVHALGRRPYSQLPAYAKGFDVGLIPFVISDLTRAVNPIKLREYLCAGLPVVSTSLPEVHDQPGVWKGSDHATFLEACDRAVEESQRGPRRSYLGAESWEAKVEQICRQIRSRTPSEKPAGLTI